MNMEANPPKIRYQSLSDLTDSQIAAVKAIPPHDQVQYKAIRATRPASMFIDPAYHELERARIFRKLPVAVALTAAIPEAGSMMAQNAYGVPLLITRDRTGKSHAFLNACLHKGATLVYECEAKKGSKITCPYHAWTWTVDGRLAGVARAETFSELEKEERKLVELPSHEAGGFIFAILDKDAQPDFSNINEELVADLEALDLGGQHLYGRKRFELNANWKQTVEPFLEGYHVQRLHAKSVGPLFADVPTVVTRMGDHIRQTSGKIEFQPADLEGEGARNIHKIVTHAYLIFPSTIVVTSPYYMSVMLIMPSATGKTSVDYHMLTLNQPDNSRAEALYKISYDTVLNVFGNEDFFASETCFTGLLSGVLDKLDVVYSGLEACIPMQYETLDKYLA